METLDVSPALLSNGVEHMCVHQLDRCSNFLPLFKGQSYFNCPSLASGACLNLTLLHDARWQHNKIKEREKCIYSLVLPKKKCCNIIIIVTQCSFK